MHVNSRHLGISLLVSFSFLLFLQQGCKNDGKGKKDKTTDTTAVKDTTPPTPTYDRYWNDYARYLAGLEPEKGSVLDSIEKEPAAVAHRKDLSEKWKRKEHSLLQPLSKWAAVNLDPQYASQRTVFYPFGGPDFLTINTLYPNAKQYILYGLEDEGKVPDIRKLNPIRRKANLENLSRSIKDLMYLSFFKTKEMRYDFKRAELQGTAPVIMAFIAAKGNVLLNVVHVKLTEDGKVEELKSAPKKEDPGDTVVTGIRYDFRKADAPADAKPQSVYFFSMNIASPAIKNQRGFEAFVKAQEPISTYIKAASYLMYDREFVPIRTFIFDVSNTLLQDDSGAPLKAFDKNVWDLTFFGSYTKPIDLFHSKFQADLKKVYADSSIKKLSFGIGYQDVPGTSNLMLAKKKK